MDDCSVRLAIVNDYEVVVRGLASLLAPSSDRIHVVELAAAEPVTQPVDVALFDVFGSGEVHAGEVERVLADPDIDRVAVYSANLAPTLVDLAIGMGVRGYLSKSLGGAELADAVCRIARGEVVVSDPPPVAVSPAGPVAAVAAVATTPVATPLAGAGGRSWPGIAHGLTEREAEVLALITQGYENDEIARRLYISVNSLKTRIRTLYRRLGFDNRVQAAVWGVQHGFGRDTSSSTLSS